MKKLSAIILAIMLVMSMLPTAFAEGEEETVELVFTGVHFYDWDNSKFYTKDESLGWDPSKYGNFNMRSVVDYGTHGWKFFDVDDELEAVAGTNMRATEIQAGNAGKNNDSSKIRPNYVESGVVKWAQEDMKLGLNLEAPKTGFWKVIGAGLNTGSGNGGINPKVKIYLAPILETEMNSDRVLNYTRADSLIGDTNTHPTFTSGTRGGRVDGGRTMSIDKVFYSDGVTDLVLVANIYTDSTEKKNCLLHFNTLTLAPVEASEIILSATETSLMKDKSTSLTVTAADSEVLDSFITYTSNAPSVATVSADGTVTALSEGKTTITATVGELSKSVEITVKEEDSELKGAFDAVEEEFATEELSTATVNTFVAKLGESKDKDTAVIASATATLGETYTVNAPAAEEGYKFLYWAKGMSTDKKQIVSYDESYSFIPTVENTYLIAVYEPTSGADDVNKAEFYNANGQLITTLTADGAAPALPEMAGYNAAEGWALYGTNDVIAAGSPVEVSGVKVYVAKFGDAKTVEVNGNEVSYGDKVSFTAAPGVGEIFKAWKKDGVIVSTAETYSFYAWEDCTVEAVYVTEDFTFTGIARKILIDTFAAGDETAVMAEFIGFEGAVEKGIMLGNKRYAMTTGATQFTIVNDEDANEIKGYAIFKDGTIVYDK
ncbi:MAG: Ig-like domain-containing protein [Oscillospiraceae bacterium]|nr:Ig-like domain-containing protein [Oscillospiraceae bacterium]